jgi:hypothetical protein
VHVEPVDERTGEWEDHRPRFRVYLFEPTDAARSLRTSTYDVTGAEALEVIAWAEQQAGEDGLYAVALVSRNPRGERGLTWLQGVDANAGPGDLRHEVLRAAMLARRGRPGVTR